MTDQRPQSLLMRRKGLITAAVVFTCGLAWLYSSGALDSLSDPERIRTLVEGYGVWGPLVFIALAMALFPVFLFGPAVWASMLLWPWPLALLYSYTAATLASVLAFAIGRRGSGGEEQIPEKLRRYSAGLLKRPTTTVIVIRLLLWANPVADLLIAVSGVSLRAYLIGTLIGMLPPTLFHVFVGAGLQELDSLPTEAWLTLGTVAVIAAVWIGVRRHRTRQAP